MNWRNYLRAELRAAHARALLCAAEIEEIGVLYKGGMLTDEEAIEAMAEIGALKFLHPEAEQLPIDQCISSNEAAAAALSHS